jgi:hypothetical protein
MLDKLRKLLGGDAPQGLPPISLEQRNAMAQAIRATTQIPVVLEIHDTGGKSQQVACIFRAMDGETDLNAAMAVFREGKIREDVDEDEIKENWEKHLRPQWRRIVCAQSVAPRFVTWEPRRLGEVKITMLTDAQLIHIYTRIVEATDTRLAEVNPNLQVSDAEWEEQFRALGEAYLMTKYMHVPLIEHCWMRASREERLYVQAVYTCGPLYEKQQRKKADAKDS